MLKYMLCGLALLLTLPARAADDLVCPVSIDVDQKYTGKDADWEARRDDGPHPLMQVNLFDGHPKEKAQLIPDEDHKGKHPTAVWLLPPSPRGYWVSCVYARTDVILTRKLDPKIKRCVVTYDPKESVGGNMVPLRIRCE